MSTYPVTLLDCTLRDGGYYTDWQFNEELVCEYLVACSSIGVDAIEIGYVRLDEGESGPYGRLSARLPESVTSILTAHQKKLAVMFDAKAALKLRPTDAVDQLHAKIAAVPGKLSILRIAVHYSQFEPLAEFMEQLSKLDLSVSVNLMQIDIATDTAIEGCITVAQQLPTLAAIYLGDSLGSMLPERVSMLVSEFRRRLPQAIGFHAHDNQGLAIHNSLTAFRAGATWLDGTMLGMGRGAGNARTENLIAVLRDAGVEFTSLNRMLARSFVPLWETHRWGPSVYYGIAGAAKIHPTYVQHLETQAGIQALSKIEVLKFLADAHATSYSHDVMQDALRSVVK
jgi:4-hydroxy 2-oxovalerate aldolase